VLDARGRKHGPASTFEGWRLSGDRAGRVEAHDPLNQYEFIETGSLIEKVENLKSSAKKACTEKPGDGRRCGCGAQFRLVHTMVDPRTGRDVRIFECKCGQQSWQF